MAPTKKAAPPAQPSKKAAKAAPKEPPKKRGRKPATETRAVSTTPEEYQAGWEAFRLDPSFLTVQRTLKCTPSKARRLVYDGIPGLQLPGYLAKLRAVLAEVEARSMDTAAADLNLARSVLAKSLRVLDKRLDQLDKNPKEIPAYMVFPSVVATAKATAALSGATLGPGDDDHEPGPIGTATDVKEALGTLLKALCAARLPGGKELLTQQGSGIVISTETLERVKTTVQPVIEVEGTEA